jgi:hypothetical protein
MRTETRTVTVGENMGPVDWSYDFRKHFDSMGASDEVKDERCRERVAWLKYVERAVRDGTPVRVTSDGGSPRCGIHPVIDVGMYDGWPFWKPTPSVCVATRFGVEWYTFSQITNVYPGERGWEALP